MAACALEPLVAFADGIFKGLEEGKTETGYSTSKDRWRMSQTFSRR